MGLVVDSKQDSVVVDGIILTSTQVEKAVALLYATPVVLAAGTLVIDVSETAPYKEYVVIGRESLLAGLVSPRVGAPRSTEVLLTDGTTVWRRELRTLVVISTLTPITLNA